MKRELLVRLEGTLAVRALDLQVSLCGAVLVLESGVGREHHIVRGELLGRRVALGPVVREDRERARRCPLEQLGAPLRERDHGQNDEGATAAQFESLLDFACLACRRTLLGPVREQQ